MCGVCIYMSLCSSDTVCSFVYDNVYVHVVLIYLPCFRYSFPTLTQPHPLLTLVYPSIYMSVYLSVCLSFTSRYKKWIMAVREKKRVLQKAAFRAYQELRNALDAAGHVYVFGGGNFKQFDAIPLNKMKTGKFTFQLFDRVLELWKDRVKPEQLVDRLRNIRKVQEDDAKRDMDRGTDGMGALGAGEYTYVEYTICASKEPTCLFSSSVVGG